MRSHPKQAQTGKRIYATQIFLFRRPRKNEMMDGRRSVNWEQMSRFFWRCAPARRRGCGFPPRGGRIKGIKAVCLAFGLAFAQEQHHGILPSADSTVAAESRSGPLESAAGEDAVAHSPEDRSTAKPRIASRALQGSSSVELSREYKENFKRGQLDVLPAAVVLVFLVTASFVGLGMMLYRNGYWFEALYAGIFAVVFVSFHVHDANARAQAEYGVYSCDFFFFLSFIP